MFYFPPECCRELIRLVSSYLQPRWPAAVSGWWGWCGVSPQWLKLFSWRAFLPHMQWGWMQEPVDLRYSQRQRRRACQGTYAQREAQLSCLTSCPCWQWWILTTLSYSWKPLWQSWIEQLWRKEKRKAAFASAYKGVSLCSHFKVMQKCFWKYSRKIIHIAIE